MEWTKKKIIMAILFLLVMIISVIVFIFIIINETFLFLTIRDYFIAPLLRIGFWAVLVFLVLMVLQSLIAPIPSELILLSGGMIFGLWWGALIGIIGSMFSAWITFYVSNKGGRVILEAAGEKMGFIDKFILVMDKWIESWGLWAIIVGRAVPVIMFDPVSYASGISNIKWKQYSIATFIGSIPRAFFYAWMGILTLDGRHPSTIIDMSAEEIENAAGRFNTIFYIIFGVLIIMLIIANIVANLNQNSSDTPKIEENVDTE